jgi:hypothetical protein
MSPVSETLILFLCWCIGIGTIFTVMGIFSDWIDRKFQKKG